MTKRKGKLVIEAVHIIDGIEYRAMTSEDHDNLEGLGVDRIDPKCLIHWTETTVKGAPEALVLSADRSTIVEVYGGRTVDRKVGATVRNEEDVNREARNVKRVLGHDFVPMTELDYNTFSGAPSDSFIYYAADQEGLVLILQPDGRINEISFDEQDGSTETLWHPVQVAGQ